MKPHSESKPAAINHDELIERMMGSAQMAERMLAKFVETSATDCADLESIIRLGNAEEIASLAHRHKGTAQTMAAPRVADIASQIETLAAAEPTSELLELVGQLRESHDEVREILATGLATAERSGEQS
jgi:HPt (histidine-containing phosphotransfer) domain-containing protein